MKLISFVIVLLTLLMSAPMASATRLSSSDLRAGEMSFQAAKSGDWLLVQRLLIGIRNPLLRKLLTWSNLVRSGANVSFHERADFIVENPDWPRQKRLRRLAEESLNFTVSPVAVVSWFKRFEPVSNKGRSLFGASLRAVGEQSRGLQVVRDTWINGDFSKTEEQEFIHRHGVLLTADDHVLRMDRLLWDGDHEQARRMLARVSPDYQALSDARLRLRHMKPGVDEAIAKVPAAMRRNPGLIYERIRWQRRMNHNETARTLLKAYSLDDVRPTLWWRERSILARRALAEGYVSEAYHAARGHAVTQGADFADGEWLSGWITLRFLDEPQRAIEHFERLFSGVNYPISRARGAYWVARAAHAAGHHASATAWFRIAAEHPTTYYGQLAAQQLARGSSLQLPLDPMPTPEDSSAFMNHELTQAVQMLARLGQTSKLRSFIVRLGELNESTVWKAQCADLASAQDQYDLAILIAKKAAINGQPLIGSGYPSIAIPEVKYSSQHGVESPLVLAMVRQESAFRAAAVSPAGARGLMQLLPDTARQVARQLKLTYSRSRLTTDANYSLKLGQAYMSGLLDRFNGSYVLALVAYNAGPARVPKWVHANGDPRESVISAIDWIELIPFSETRNYVQRILESLQVYRTTLDKKGSTLTIEADLKR